jgi:hypothetical protein
MITKEIRCVPSVRKNSRETAIYERRDLVRVFVDQDSRNILTGATVDYSDAEEDHGFNFALAQPVFACTKSTGWAIVRVAHERQAAGRRPNSDHCRHRIAPYGRGWK